jgi:hypothetical protein
VLGLELVEGGRGGAVAGDHGQLHVYYRRKLAEGTSPNQALRCLKRRLSDAAYRCLLTDAVSQT